MLVNNEVIDNLKELKINNLDKFNKEINKISKELFDEYCIKKNYKEECDPFCADAFINTCQYLKEMNKLWNIFGRKI